MPEESNLENKGAREWVPFLLSIDQEIACPERHGYGGRSRMVHHLTGKQFPEGHYTK